MRASAGRSAGDELRGERLDARVDGARGARASSSDSFHSRTSRRNAWGIERSLLLAGPPRWTHQPVGAALRVGEERRTPR